MSLGRGFKRWARCARLPVSVETVRPGRVHGAAARRPRALPRYPLGECSPLPMWPIVQHYLFLVGLRARLWLSRAFWVRVRCLDAVWPRGPGPLAGSLKAQCRKPERALGLSRAARAYLGWPGLGGVVPSRRTGVGAPHAVSVWGVCGAPRNWSDRSTRQSGALVRSFVKLKAAETLKLYLQSRR